MNRLTFVTLSALVLACLFGCGGIESARLEDLENPSDSPIGVTSDYPAVVKVILPMGSGMCTGTFISPRAILTAAHCTQTAGSYRIYSSFGTFLTSHVENMGAGNLGDSDDISLLILNTDAADASEGQVYTLGDDPAVLDSVRLVGFGCNDQETRAGSGVKRTGVNQLWRKGDFLEIATPLNTVAQATIKKNNFKGILGPENRAGACFGDSGGPMLAERGGKWEIVGVSHSGQWSSDLAISRYSNMNNFDNWRFVQNLDNDYDLGIRETCVVTAADPNSSCDYQPAFMQLFNFFKRLWTGLINFFGV